MLAEVRNGKLIVRVGGGWVPIEDFLRHFADELARDSPESRTPAFKNLMAAFLLFLNSTASPTPQF